MTGQPAHTPPGADDLTEFVAILAEELSLQPGDIPIGEILRAAKTVAHGAIRPGAPVSAFAAGLAIGRAQLTDSDAFAAIARAVDAYSATRQPRN